MGCRNAGHGQPKLVKIRRQCFFVLRTVDLVDCHKYILAALAQILAYILIHTRQPFSAIDHKHDQIRSSNGLPGLLENFLFHLQGGVQDNAPGIHEGKGFVQISDIPEQGIPGHPGFIMGDGPFFSQKAVEQGRLAHIGTPHNGDQGKGSAHDNDILFLRNVLCICGMHQYIVLLFRGALPPQ